MTTENPIVMAHLLSNTGTVFIYELNLASGNTSETLLKDFCRECPLNNMKTNGQNRCTGFSIFSSDREEALLTIPIFNKPFTINPFQN
jgi:hypothetical protein